MSKVTEEKTVSQNEETKVREARYFSEAFHKKIVKDIEDKLTTVAGVCRDYEVSRTSVHKWIRLYSLNYQKQIVKVVELESESHKRKLLEKELAETQKVAGGQAVEIVFLNKLIEIIETTFDIDLKKNINSKSFAGLENIRKKEKPPV